MASKARITDKQLKAWQANPPKSAQSCGDGLYFRAYASGSAQWYFRYTLGGKPRWHKLGNYPGLTLAEARKELRKQKVGVDQGTDIALDAQLERKRKAKLESFEEIARAWYARGPEQKLDKPEIVLRRMEIHIFPVLGKLPIERVSPRDIGELISKLGAEKPTVANKVLSDIQKVYKHAGKFELVQPGYNPAAHFDWSDAGGAQSSRDRVLSDEELIQLLKKCAGSPRFGRPNELSIWLILALCERKMAVLAARWDAIDLDKGVWTLERSTNKSTYTIAIPLAPPLIEWFKELRILAGRSDYVFPARRISKQARYPHVSTDTLNRALDELEHGGLKHFTVHDLRRTARSHLAALGVQPHIAERVLNHKLKGQEAIYDRYDYFAERKDALSKWAQHLCSLIRKAEQSNDASPANQ